MKASFIDLGGNTARVDPQTTPTAYIRLQLFWQAVYDDSSGAEVNSPRAGEIYMTVEQADVLAEALKNARMTNTHPRTTTEADTLRAAQAAPAAVAGPSDRIPIEDSIAWQETGTGVERNAVMVSGRTWYRDDHPLLAPTTQAAPQPAAPASQDAEDALMKALERAYSWMDSQADAQSKGGHATFDLMMLREERDAAKAAIDAARSKQEAK